MKKIALLPTLCTLAGGACGFGSITFAAKVATDSPGPTDLRWLAIAGWLIFAALAFDILDGHLARLSRSTSEFGGQLDSLCDVISFGIAPAFVLMRMCWDFPDRGLWLIAALYVICVVLRLARYNVETGDDAADHLEFSGLPSPAAAGTLAAFAILLYQLRAGELFGATATADTGESLAAGGALPWDTVLQTAMPFGTLLLALLMVSRISYPHLINQILQGHHRFRHIVMLVFSGVAIMLVHELSLPLIFTVFCLGAPLRCFWEEVVLRRPREEPVF